MAAGGSIRSVAFVDRPPTPGSPVSSIAATETHPQYTLDPRSSHTQISSADKASIWELPGLNKTTFYAAALYLNAAGGVLKAKPWYGEVKTPESTRNFLDHLADCFALSKGEDARDHVSATAMVRNDQQQKITLYIAKNKSDKGGEPGKSPSSEEPGTVETNPNEDFAKLLVGWFNELTRDTGAKDTYDPHDAYRHVFHEMCKFTKSRLEYYIQKVSDTRIDARIHDVDYDVGAKHIPAWTEAKTLIENCQEYEIAKSSSADPSKGIIFTSKMLEDCACLAGKVRKSDGFRILTQKIESLPPNKDVKKKIDLPNLAQLVKWINYLGRLFAAFVGFYKFCRDKNQSGWHFEYVLLRSQEHDWDSDAYMQKVRSWTADFGQIVAESTPVESRMGAVVTRSGNKARVHCEMQLMMHFLQPDVEQCVDYFSCSKKSCWLCWHMILQDSKHSIKQAHRKLYPRWAFPYEFSSSQPAVSEGLTAVYNEMLHLIQKSIIRQQPITFLERFPETSVRQTPLHSGLLSAQPIVAPERGLWSRVVPVLHLPADGDPGDLLQTQVCAYRYDDPDHLTAMMKPVSTDDHEMLFAFQLITMPASLSPDSGIDKYQNALWSVEFFAPISPLRIYMMYYRSASSLSENPQITSIWERVYGQEPQPSPWRGDVFIFRREWAYSSAFDASEFSPPDGPEFPKDLENWFREEGAQYFSETAEASLRCATTQIEWHQQGIKDAGKVDEFKQKLWKNWTPRRT